MSSIKIKQLLKSPPINMEGSLLHNQYVRNKHSISSIYLKIYLSDFIQAQDSDKIFRGLLKELGKTKL